MLCKQLNGDLVTLFFRAVLASDERAALAFRRTDFSDVAHLSFLACSKRGEAKGDGFSAASLT